MYAEIMVDVANSEVDRKFDYYFEGGNVFVGSRVIVPFGARKINGVVVKIKDDTDFDKTKIKSIIGVSEDIPALTEESLKTAEFIQKRYHVTRALALRLFLPSEMRRDAVGEKTERVVFLSDVKNAEEVIGKQAKKQAEAYGYLKDTGEEKFTVLSKKFGAGAINALIEKGVCGVKEVKVGRSPYSMLTEEKKRVELTKRQQEAVESIENTDKTITLLHGVTGSGKTEVYLRLINDTLEKGRTAVMLVPEIALTPQMLRQLRARFGNVAAIFHSGLNAGEKYDEWWRLRNGEARVVIGARSAIFSPVENVGLIIIDEEHDSSYYSEKSPRYGTLEIANFRAKYNGAKIVLGSATPSIETYNLAKKGVYNLAVMPERINKKPLPEIIIADMRKEIRRGNHTEFSSTMKEELKNCLDEGGQAMIFLNRRGYSQYVICTECGYVPKCKDCDVSLTYHYDDDSLKCHYCGAKYHMITSCPECGSKFLRYGALGTQKVVIELQKLFPQARILRMDNDTTASKDGHLKILSAFQERKADILVGTQMIAKGHDFAGVTFVGIIDADMSLHFSDYRSGERTFQLITQVAGRSGRADKQGKVVLQTYSPDNYVLGYATSYDYEGFYERELAVRQATKFPPFAKVVRVLATSTDETECIEGIKYAFTDVKELREKYPDKFIFANCMKAPVKRIQNKFRFQILLRLTGEVDSLVDEIYFIAKKYTTAEVTLSVEENPANMS